MAGLRTTTGRVRQASRSDCDRDLDPAVISMRWAGARVRPGLGRVLGRGRSPEPARVLVADDDAAIRQLIAVYLTGAGFSVVLAPSGSAALELAASAGVHVAVLDAGMPPPAGWEVAGQLRRAPSTAAVRTVVLWPDGRHGGSPSGQCGADACLAKPFSPPELVALVAGLAGRTPFPRQARHRHR
jgi:DNA-binding response OmpR family regulator